MNKSYLVVMLQKEQGSWTELTKRLMVLNKRLILRDDTLQAAEDLSAEERFTFQQDNDPLNLNYSAKKNFVFTGTQLVEALYGFIALNHDKIH